MDVTDQPNSICQVQRIEMYQLPECKTILPFSLLAGEAVKHNGNTRDGPIIITNYRLYLQIGRKHHHVPLGLIEIVEHKELFYLHIGCKDARTYRCTFENAEMCLEWFEKMQKAADPPRQLNQLFAFWHYAHSKTLEDDICSIEYKKQYTFNIKAFKFEMKRLQFEETLWRISEVNINYEMCSTYPPYLLVPKDITDDELKKVAKFRSSRRIPAVVWRHTKNGAVVARCSQPEVGWFGWRGNEDETLMKLISKDTDSKNQEKKVLILDARSYAIAVANRARGGGCECPEYYPNCEIQFMNLANIHYIRKSFHALRQLCTSSSDQTWHSQLESTKWLQHMSGLMKAAVTLVTAVDVEARPVVVHCSDGWDRTPQIVALAELLLDPFYRTIEGFRVLIEREWLAFGHKFADRCGHSTGSEDQNERCPVFLQWLDCVHQLVKQDSCAFEFSLTFLVKLAQHTYSNLYGTFLCNTLQERLKIVNGKTFSVWDFLNAPRFKNHLYNPPSNFSSPKIIWPQCNVRDLYLWKEVYMGTMEANFRTEGASESCPGPPTENNEILPYLMTKTRSYNDLMDASDIYQSHFRRNSDPNLNSDVKIDASVFENGDTEECPNNVENKELNLTPQIMENEDETTDCNPDCIFQKSSDYSINPEELSENLNKIIINNQNIAKNDIPLVHCNGHEKETNFLNEAQEPENLNKQLDENEAVIVIEENKTKVETDLKKECDKIKNTVDEPILTPLVAPLVAPLVTQISTNSELSDNTENSDIIESVGGPLPDEIVKSCDNVCDASLEKSELILKNGIICDEEEVIDHVFNMRNFIMEKVPQSIETSTETLVSGTVLCGSSPKEINGFEKITSPSESVDVPDNFLTFNGKTYPSNPILNNGNAASTEDYPNINLPLSDYSASPLNSRSRTSSSNGWDNTFNSSLLARNSSFHNQNNCQLGEDGLVPLISHSQDRVLQIIEESKRKEEQFEQELHTYRQVFLRQVCHKCNHLDEKLLDDARSTIESNCSGMEQASAIESLRSDMSWENVDYNNASEINGTKWVPDHAVSRCTHCQTKFWIGKRKHHCRKCGNIFCADCSENTTPLPSEQLFEPVRVCTGCFTKIARDHLTLSAQISSQCKENNQQNTNTNQQITASSN